jgi:hypothetical protein
MIALHGYFINGLLDHSHEAGTNVERALLDSKRGEHDHVIHQSATVAHVTSCGSGNCAALEHLHNLGFHNGGLLYG